MSRGVATTLFLLITCPAPIHAVGTWVHAIEEATLRAWLLAAEAGLKTAVLLAFALFIFLRPPSRKPSRRPIAWLACAGAILSVAFLHAPSEDAALGAVIAGEAIVILAVAFTFTSVAFLGRCFGVLPEVRGLVMRGPYRIIRHPVYLGEIGAFVGFVVASQHWLNIVPLLVFTGSQLVRMRFEEAALSEEYPDEYGAYAARTPRLLPALRPRRPHTPFEPEVASPANA